MVGQPAAGDNGGWGEVSKCQYLAEIGLCLEQALAGMCEAGSPICWRRCCANAQAVPSYF